MSRRARSGRVFSSVGEIRPRELIAQALRAIGRSDSRLPSEQHARGAGGRSAASGCRGMLLALCARAQTVTDAIDACDRAIAVLPDHAPFHAPRASAFSALAATPGRAECAPRLAPAPDDARAVDAHRPRALPSDELRRHPASDTDSTQPATAVPLRGGLAIRAPQSTDERRDDVLSRQRARCGDSDRGDPHLRRTRCASSARCAAHLNNRPGLALRRQGGTGRARGRRYEEALPPATHPWRPMPISRDCWSVSSGLSGGGRALSRVCRPRPSMRPPTSGRSLRLCQHRLGALYAAEKATAKRSSSAPSDGDVQHGLAALLVEDQPRSGEAQYRCSPDCGRRRRQDA